MTDSLRRLIGALALAAAPAFGTDLPLETGNASVEDVSQAGLERAVEQARAVADGPVWLAWEVEGVPGRGSICCGHGCCCDVEQTHGGIHIEGADAEGPIAILVRFSDGEPSRIRIVDRDCPIGFGGRRVLWVGRTETRISLGFLDAWAATGSRRVAEGAVMAIAHHRSPEAMRWLEARATANDGDLAEEAIFWIGLTRGEEGLASLRRILAGDLGFDRREAAIFGLAQSPVPEARDDLARLARNDASPRIRSEALFWLGQADDGETAELIYDAALTDPDPDVARQAVFVLSQLPESQALEHLARLLVQEERREIREDALFWIGQTNSDEALEIVSGILND
jgi:HEAT repeat protein